MCLILFAHDVHPEYRLILAANRDEFFDRPTEPLHRWPDAAHVIAGRDLIGGGTWLGVSDGGRWAAVTNFREAASPRPDAPTRGHLVSGFLESGASPAEYAATLLPRAAVYNGFNLLVGDERDVVWISNRGGHGGGPTHRSLESGVYGVSNHLLDTPWPKVTRGKEELHRILDAPYPPAPDHLLELLLDRAYAAEHELPDTGLDLRLERALSSFFVSTADYGTRSSSALLIARDGRIEFAERRFDAEGQVVGENRVTA